MRTIIMLVSLFSVLGAATDALADEQTPPVQEEAREQFRTFPYSESGIREFVTTEFAASKQKVNTEEVIQILIRDLAKEGAGGFRIAPSDLDYTFEYRRVGPNVTVDKVAK